MGKRGRICPPGVFMSNDVVNLAQVRASKTAGSKGYKSGRSSWRETPEARSTSSTRSGGTFSHCNTACFVMPNDSASRVNPPAAKIARLSGVSDMAGMSSTASHESQASLHLQRKPALYAAGMDLGSKIKKARKAKGLSLDRLGTLLGVTRQAVWQWEKGDSDPSKHVEALCHHLGVPASYFYGGAPADSLENKIRRLTPERQQNIEDMIDALLFQQDQEEKIPKRRVK